MIPRASGDGVERSMLVDLAMQGDQDAFGRLAAASIDRMHGVAWLILRDQHDAEDAVQEALVRAWRELPRLRDSDRFDAWLRRLLVNACHDVGRRHRRHAAMRLVELQVEPMASTAGRRSTSGSGSDGPFGSCRWTSERSSHSRTTWA